MPPPPRPKAPRHSAPASRLTPHPRGGPTDELGYGEDEAEEEARQERLRMAQEAASSSSTFADPDERGYYLADLFGKAAYVDAAVIMDHGAERAERV